jgi:hypothetical protein
MARTAKRKSKADYDAERTTDHEEIRRWAVERGGHSAVVEGNRMILRIDFDEPGGNDDEALRRVSWEEFFRVLDERVREFLYVAERNTARLPKWGASYEKRTFS